MRGTSTAPASLVLLRLTWATGVVATLAVWLADAAPSAIRAPEVHLVLDTADGLVASVVCGLLVARARRTRSRSDHLLAQALAAMAFASLVLSIGAHLVLGEAGYPLWAEVAARSGAVVILVGAVLVPVGTTTAHRRPVALALVLVLSLVLAAGTPWLPDALPGADESSAAGGVHPLLTTIAAVVAFLALLVAVLMSRRHRSGEDVLSGCLAPGLVLLAFARLHYAAFPSIYTEYVFSGDALRTAGYAVLLVGAVREVLDHWTAESRSARLDERHRMARELHDGAVQEMTLARLEAAVLVRQGDPALANVLASMDRALTEVRAAMDDLVSADDQLDVLVPNTVRSLGARLGVVPTVHCEQVAASSHERHQVVRIVREAVSNAARHGGATRVIVTLSQDRAHRRLVVADDGSGFDVDAERRGHGLVSMHERAATIGGHLELRSAPGDGTVVEVVW